MTRPEANSGTSAALAGWPALFWLSFQCAANPMGLFRPDRVIVALNRAYESTLGFVAEDVVGRRVDSIVSPREWRRLDIEWEQLVRTGRLVGHRDLVRADGRRVSVRFKARREVIAGSPMVLSVVSDQTLRPPVVGGSRLNRELTVRELEVITQVARGRRASEIAESLTITVATVRTHQRNAMAKLGARSQAQMVATALVEGLLDGARLSLSQIEARS